MGNPVPVPCPQGEWTKIMDSALQGTAHAQTTDIELLYAWHETATPIVDLNTVKVPMCATQAVSFSVATDVYVYPIDGDTTIVAAYLASS